MKNPVAITFLVIMLLAGSTVLVARFLLIKAQKSGDEFSIQLFQMQERVSGIAFIVFALCLIYTLAFSGKNKK